MVPGWLDIDDAAAGMRVVLDLPLEPRVTVPDGRIDAVRAAAALERGPLVLCLESVDLPAGVALDDVRLTASPPRPRADGARAVLTTAPGAISPDAALPYGSSPPDAVAGDTFEADFVLYHRWAERGPSTMRVFVPLDRRDTDSAAR